MLIRRPGQAWHALPPALTDERTIQALLAQSPGLLPPTGPGELAVATNFRVGAAGPIDIIGVGVDGRLVLVECGRQEGVARTAMGGPALAVAAGLWRLPYDEFDRTFSARAGVGVSEAVGMLASAGGLPFEEPAFQAAVAANLAAGRFAVVFAVDVVNDEVRRLVSYLNGGARSGLSAVALGLRYLAEDGVEILIPTLHKGDVAEATAAAPTLGASRPAATRLPAPRLEAVTPEVAAVRTGVAGPVVAAVAEAAVAETPAEAEAEVVVAEAAGAEALAEEAPVLAVAEPAEVALDEPDAEEALAVDAVEAEAALFAALETSCLPSAVAVLRRVYELAAEKGSTLEWGVGEHPSVTAFFDVDGEPIGVWSCYTDLKPSFVVNFEWLAGSVPPERLERLANDLSQLPSVPERVTGLADAGYKRRLALAVNAVLAQPEAGDVIVGAIETLLDPETADSGAASG